MNEREMFEKSFERPSITLNYREKDNGKLIKVQGYQIGLVQVFQKKTKKDLRTIIKNQNKNNITYNGWVYDKVCLDELLNQHRTLQQTFLYTLLYTVRFIKIECQFETRIKTF